MLLSLKIQLAKVGFRLQRVKVKHTAHSKTTLASKTTIDYVSLKTTL